MSSCEEDDGDRSREARRSSRERAWPAAHRRVAAGAAEIVVARYAGYCYGVERALKIVEDAIGGLPAPIHSLGPIIHNPAVVKHLAERGVTPVENLDEAQSGTVIVRTHGVPPAVIAAARERGVEVVDATCPFVNVAQHKATTLRQKGYVVLILGERNHPEVIGLKACAGERALVLEDAGELVEGAVTGRRVGIVVQTTQTRANLARLVARVAPLARELLVYNTICDATEKRQSAAREVAAAVDVVVVVGGRNSANTSHLAAVCREIQPATYHVEHADEIDSAWFADVRHIGVAAGASTPDDDIEATVQAIRLMLAAAS
jgi:4-hydroxy-3-methylbut-2-enyl diphosphate reductase